MDYCLISIQRSGQSGVGVGTVGCECGQMGANRKLG
jgi:hypothetical protein